MSSNYHTPLTDGPAQLANAAKFNGPFGTLDAAITTARAESAAATANALAASVAAQVVMDAVLLNGSAVTLADGAATAGQKVVTVDASSIFVAGCGVEYQLAGGTREYNTVASVDSATQITLSVNIGTGGIADDGLISVVPIGLYNLLGTNPGGLFVGSNVASGDDSGLLIGRAATNPLASGGSHGVRDESTYIAAAEGGYAAFDAIPKMSGATAYNHLCAFQARPEFAGSNTLAGLFGFDANLNASAGTTDLCYGLYVRNPAGAGVINFLAGIRIASLTRGTANYGIYTDGSMPSYFGGTVQTGGNLTAAGVVSGSNLITSTDNNSALVGTGIGAETLYHATVLGYNAAHSLAWAGQYNTILGETAGYTLATGVRNVLIGYGAGYYETGSDKLMIDNAPRASEADARTKALLYGVFAGTVAGQSLSINADLDHNGDKVGFYGVAPIARALLATGAGATVDNVITALQNLGLVKQS